MASSKQMKVDPDTRSLRSLLRDDRSYHGAELLTNANRFPSGDQEGTLIVP